MFKKYFDDYEIGERWHSKGRTVTEADIVNFAGFSGDWYSLHTDVEYAKTTPFKQRIAHGMLVLSAASGLQIFEPGIVVAFYGMDQVRFTNPTFIGDTIHVEMTVEEMQDKGNGTGVLTAKQEVKKQTGETVITGTIKVLLNKR
ncbi:acyl dehydratase [Melghirimyces profundicolus]|uniref:Acyl dehydratase n=1 Tax=Melghirimyces profundicolus TaxID=1242148 RepID=A0A2T6C0N2_9BACL|nr:MaoC/PaaZ C-terminal domain-containing protein [Melghirimyces profundicolus]PTX61868.1 acyl dehydratase [Melghirimyces profundicolus]